ncbi:MAG TPA: tetratricopeptide repeat protein [Dyella sp.]|uniref:tetratricopeptide repeat protein n=1 Tax=Dyella sp. TaxID=1869338 RepID=UPI002C8640D2|nr:tetratricopeptide repeat protein [Dyella sp.]HTV85487.1 tetratricopeptide repeat protein [Dyella sp.]
MTNASLKMLAGAAFALMLASTPALASDHSSSSGDQKAATLYPNATRKAPKNDLTNAKEAKALQEGLTAANAGDLAKATPLLQPLIDSSKSKYAQAKALQGLAFAHAKNNDVKTATDMIQRALALDSLDNDDYFQMELQLANFYLVNQQFQQTIDTLEKWRADGHSDNVDSHGWEGEAYYGLKKYPEAIAQIKQAQAMNGGKSEPNWDEVLLQSYNATGQKDLATQIAQKQLSTDSSNPVAFENNVNLLVQTQKYPEAMSLLEKGRTQGLLKDKQEYVILAKLHMMAAQQADDPKPDSDKAIAVLKEGISKGVVPDDAESNELLGDAAFNGGDYDTAIAAYKKAIPDAKTGEIYVKAGLAQLENNNYTDAKQLIQQGINKGVQHKGRAYMDLAQANIGLKDKAGAATAMLDAEKDPETAAQAKAWLQKAGVGN